MQAGTGKTPSIDLTVHPTGGIQCVPGGGSDAPGGLVLAWEGALVDDENAYVPLVAAIAEGNLDELGKGLYVIPSGIRYVRGNVTALTSGKVRIVALGQAHAGD